MPCKRKLNKKFSNEKSLEMMDECRDYRPRDAIDVGSAEFLQSLGIMILYGGCGVFLIAFDKILFIHFHFAFPTVLLLMESVVLLIIMESLR